jgi:hypothetical protein
VLSGLAQEPVPRAGTGPARSRRAGPRGPSSRAARPEAVIHSLAAGSPTRRSPPGQLGRRTRRELARSAASMSAGTSHRPSARGRRRQDAVAERQRACGVLDGEARRRGRRLRRHSARAHVDHLRGDVGRHEACRRASRAESRETRCRPRPARELEERSSPAPGRGSSTRRSETVRVAVQTASRRRPSPPRPAAPGLRCAPRPDVYALRRP